MSIRRTGAARRPLEHGLAILAAIARHLSLAELVRVRVRVRARVSSA